MKLQKVLLAWLTTLVFSSTAMAHSNHAHQATIDQTQAETASAILIHNLVGQEKLAASWSDSTVAKTTQQSTPQGKVWVIEYTNSSIADKRMQTLYVVLDELGNPVSATYEKP